MEYTKTRTCAYSCCNYCLLSKHTEILTVLQYRAIFLFFSGPVTKLVRVFMLGNRRPWVRSPAMTYQSLNMVLAAPCLALKTYWVELGQVMWLGVVSSVKGMILQWSNTYHKSEHWAACQKHCCDMTEKLLKTMLNPNKQQLLSVF